MQGDNFAADPIIQFNKWYQEAQAGFNQLQSKNRIISLSAQSIRRLLVAILPWSNLLRPDIATLATTTTQNKPAARSVLFKGIVHGGFSFFTDYKSNKGLELQVNPSAVMVFYWHFPPRQVRIDGTVVKLSRKEAEDDWKKRRRVNQAASAAVTQSRIIKGREELIDMVNQVKQQYQGKPIPCPKSWGGYYLIPENIEFWEGRINWIHIRERYYLDKGTWQRQILAP